MAYVNHKTPEQEELLLDVAEAQRAYSKATKGRLNAAIKANQGGVSLQDIGNVLGMSKSGVSHMITRAKKKG